MGAGAAVGRVGVGTGSAAAASVGDDDAMGESGCGGGLHFRMGLLLCGGAVMATAARGDDGVLTATGEGGIEDARLILRRDGGNDRTGQEQEYWRTDTCRWVGPARF
jgi:hypothetical protein